MYTAISLATYRQAKAAANNGNAQQIQVPFLQPPGPHSGYLVFQGDEVDPKARRWGSVVWGNRVRKLPFPQDKCLNILDTENDDRLYFIPVPGQPISSNRYYVVRAAGTEKGLVETCSKEEDMMPVCCCGTSIVDISPRTLEPYNPYQEMQIFAEEDRFIAKSITSDGFPPECLRGIYGEYWKVVADDLRGEHGRLAYVGGENASLRAQPPPFNFLLSEKTSPIVTVGEWYCPFIFIHEKGNRFQQPKNQLMDTPFYKMDLEKFWEEIYRTEVSAGGENIFLERTIRVEEPLVLGSEAVEERRDEDGSVWMEGLVQQKGKLNGVRLSRPIIAKMRADQGREEVTERDVRVEKLYNNIGIGRKFVCFVVVERHCDQIQGKWGQ